MNKMASDRKYKSLDSGSDAMPTEYAVSSPSHVAGDGKGITETGAAPYSGHSDNNNTSTITYKVYRRRFFGLFQLALLNLVISWDWLTFSSISTSSAQYFRVSQSDINWLSTAFLLAFCVTTPAVIYILNNGGPKKVIIVASGLILVGNWVRYAGTRANGGHFGVVMFGQLLLGLAQPFVLASPTRYSDLWFSANGRTSATALATLANPLGAALGQLVDSFLVLEPGDVPNMVLYIAIISSAACLPSFFIPAKPPTPPSASSAIPKTPLRESAVGIMKNREFWLIFVPFSVYVGFFNSVSGLINQILYPYGFSQTDAGIAGGVLIIAGLVASAIVSPINDRYKQYLTVVRICVPIHAISYIAFNFAPPSPFGIAPSIVVCALLGTSAFSLLPVILEYLVEVTHPFSPEVGTSLCWMGGQILGAVFTIIQTALTAGPNADPPYNMKNALIFSSVVASVAVLAPLSLNLFGRKIVTHRLEADVRHGRPPGGPANLYPLHERS